MRCFALGLAVVLSLLSATAADVFRFSNDVYEEAVQTQFISASSGLDAPKLCCRLNATTFDWWYFDAVSETSNASVVIAFYLGANSAFPFLPNGTAISADIGLTLEDGTQIYVPVGNAPGARGTATIVTYGDGSSGLWNSTGFRWVGSSDLSYYVVQVDAPDYNITGNLVLYSTAPPHYPCGPNQAGLSMEATPHIGWSNAIPDARALASFTVNDKSLAFEGIGYHDKNWADAPFVADITTWYWGHGRLGPYSVVWFDTLDTNGKEHVSGYVAKDSVVLTASCANDAASVRPIGKNSQFPPTIVTGNPDGFHVTIDLGQHGALVFDVFARSILLGGTPNFPFIRWAGSMTGGIKGGQNYTGTALYDEFKLTPP